MPIGKIVKISDKLHMCCIESINEFLYVDLDAMPTGYAKCKRVEYNISIDNDGKKTASNLKLLPSVLTEWHPIRRN